MLLIFPPVAKPCEPPAGIAKLAGALNAHGVSCEIFDANLEGMLHLLRLPNAASDTWTRRAVKHCSSNIEALRNPDTYRCFDRYSRAVKDVNRVLEASGERYRAAPGLADYRHQALSPVRSADLIHAAAYPEQNPFFPWFSRRLSEFFDGSAVQRQGREEKLYEPAHDAVSSRGFIGLSLNYLSQALCTFAMIGHIRKTFPECKIVLGGGLVSSWMKNPGWNNPFKGLVDHLIAGPGEGPLLRLLGVKELDHRHTAPDYRSLLRREYLSPGFILPYSGSNGCYWNKCSFCPETAEGNPYVPVPAEEAMTDLNALIAKTDPVLVHLLDNAVSPALMRKLAINPIGVPWYGFARIETDLTDLDYCIQLKRSGCRMLKIGLESGDQGVLDRMSKGIDLTSASLVLNNLRAAGVAASVYLLFGTPTETIREARKTLAFVVAHRQAITYLNLAIFNMPACGPKTGEYETEPFYDGDLSLYTAFRHPKGWDRMHVRRFLDAEFKKQPVVSDILQNDPPLFTSNHAAFFTNA